MEKAMEPADKEKSRRQSSRQPLLAVDVEDEEAQKKMEKAMEPADKEKSRRQSSRQPFLAVGVEDEEAQKKMEKAMEPADKEKSRRHSSRQPFLAIDVEDEEVISEAPEEGQSRPKSLRRELISLLRKLVGESLACFMVVFTIMAVKVNTYSLESDGAASLLALSLAGGMATTVTIFATQHVSGSHINPVITIAYTFIKHFPLQLAPLYVCAQLMGGIMAALVLDVVCKPDRSLVLVTRSGTVFQAVAAECVACFLLLFVCASVATDTRAIYQFAGFAIGTIIALDILIAGPISGGGINPARALGPALVYWNFTDLWIYFVGPFAGATIGAFLYWLLRPARVKKEMAYKEIDVKAIFKGLSQ